VRGPLSISVKNFIKICQTLCR